MMIHFAGNPQCPQLQGGGQLSSASTHEEYRKIFDLTPIPDRYCKICVSIQAPRTDSDRYTELRKLVEAWQEAHRQHDQARTTAPETEGWLKHWLNFCDAQKPLLDWSHR